VSSKKRGKKILEKKKHVKKVRCDILKAFAMMGALAWQATIIKMLVSCAGWEIAQGVVFHPWVLPALFVSLCPASCCWPRLTHHHHGVLQIEWSYSATPRYNWI
jgi:hypothetical protein